MSAVESERRDSWLWWLSGAAAVLLGAGWYLPTEASLRGGLGMPLVVGWLVWGAALGVAQYRGLAAVQIRWQWADVAWLGLIGWLLLSVAVGLARSSLEPRPALALAWQYIALAVLYLGTRVLGRGAWPDAVIRCIVALGLSVSVFAFFQYTVALPELHRQYEWADESSKVAMLIAAGVAETEPGSRMRELFESRLFNREPFAAFSLANTLGTVLVPVTVLAWVGLHVGVERRRWAVALGWGAAWVALGGAMALTSSRTALLAVLLVSVVWWIGRQAGLRGWWRRQAVELNAGTFKGGTAVSVHVGRWWMVALVSLPLILLAGLWGAGQSDNQLFSGAPASVQYRWQYWVASAEMIVARPWFGCGPGNFQSAYAKYQAAEASETVADPHNFFFELAATAGLPAGVLICVAVALTLAAAQQTPQGQPLKYESFGSGGLLGGSGPWIAMVLAGLAGLSVGWLGESWPSPLWAVAVGVGVAAAWWWLLEAWAADADGVARVGMPWGLAALLLSLLASGGINYPVIGQLVFLLGATVVTAAEPLGPSGHLVTLGRVEGRADRRWWLVCGGVTGLLAIGLYVWETLPVIRAQWAMQNAQVWLRMGNLPAGQQALRTVVALDPWRADAPVELAVLGLVTRSRELSDEATRRGIAGRLRQAAGLRPDSSPVRRRIAEAHLQCLAQVSPRDPARAWLWSETRWWLQEAAARKPGEREVLAQLSWLSWSAGAGAEARELAREVQQLAGRNVHEDLRWDRQWFTALRSELPIEGRLEGRELRNDLRGEAESTAGADVREGEGPALLYREIGGGVPGLVEVNVASWVEWVLANEVTAK